MDDRKKEVMGVITNGTEILHGLGTWMTGRRK